MDRPYRDRREAGRALAAALAEARPPPGRDALVLALPRGGVPVAREVADAFDLPLDVLVVRKIGFPGHPEFAMGALASGGALCWNEEVLERTAVSRDALEAALLAERRELERRERAYRGGRPFPHLAGRTAVLVDDGLATGSTMLAAVQSARKLGAERVVVAVPVAPRDAVRHLERAADQVVVPLVPSRFHAVGEWYLDFSQLSDDEVRALLEESAR